MSRAALLETGGAAAALGAALLIACAPVASVKLLAPVALLLVVGWIVWSDVSDFTIPDGASLGLAGLALAIRLAAESLSFEAALWALFGGAVCGGALWAVREVFYRLRGHDGLGFGDVKLAFAAGVLVGPEGFAVALFGASVAGLAVAAVRREQNEKLPLGALLAPAALAVWALGLAPL